MVMTSDQIAQMHGMYQGAAYQNFMMSNALSSMSTPYGRMGSEGYSERLAGGAINTASAMLPVASLGMGLLGLDPLSLGMRAGFGVGGTFGLGAGVAAGAGVASVAGMGAMAASYAANQGLQGMQQQQALNNSLRQNFTFQNQWGGRGFDRQSMSQIGQGIRQMSTQQGHMGEMHSFEELSRLAANMGRMGMGQNIRSAREFSDKFKQMVTGLKEIAQEFGTTLEEAQKMMAGMRNVGVFKTGDVTAMARRISAGALAGNMSTSEFTSMQSIGAQISRSIGGLGRSGQAAGVQALTHVGSALASGVLTEQQIYETTGLSGAEGRRAMATGMLEREGQFFSSRLGRRALAAMAGRNGRLDRESVERFMNGDIGTDETMQMAGQNLSKIGRANFIRNEGRLRGEAMAQFGGTGHAMVMQGWLRKRGIDVGTGGSDEQDRALIFMQRRLGMGTEEAENMVRMIQGMPEMMRQRNDSASLEQYARGERERLSKQGLEGVKRKIEKFSSDVNNTLRQAGADMYKDISDRIESFVNILTDTKQSLAPEGMAEFARQSDRAGGAGTRARSAVLGRSGSTASLKGGTAVAMTPSVALTQGIRQGLGMSVQRNKILGSLDAHTDAIREAIAGGASEDETQRDRVDRILGVLKGSKDVDVQKLLRATGVGADGKQLSAADRLKNRAALAAYAEKAAMGVDFSEGASGLGALKQKHGEHAGGGMAELLRNLSDPTKDQAAMKRGLGQMISGRTSLIDRLNKGTVTAGDGSWSDYVYSGAAKEEMLQVGEMFMGESIRPLAGQIDKLIGGGGGQAKTTDYVSVLQDRSTMERMSDPREAAKRLAELGGKKDLTSIEIAERDLLHMNSIQSEMDALESKGKLTKDAKAALAKKLSARIGRPVTVDQMDGMMQGLKGGKAVVQQAAREEYFRSVRSQHGDELSADLSSGKIQASGGKLELSEAAAKGLDKASLDYTNRVLQTKDKLSTISDETGGTVGYESLIGQRDAQQEELAGMSDKQLEMLSKSGVLTRDARYFAHRRKVVDKAATRAAKYGASGKAMNAAAAALGIDLSSEELAGMKGQSLQDAAGGLVERLGIDGEKGKRLKEILGEFGGNRTKADLHLRQFLDSDKDLKEKVTREGIRGNQSKSLDAVVDALGDIKGALGKPLQVNVLNMTNGTSTEPTKPPKDH